MHGQPTFPHINFGLQESKGLGFSYFNDEELNHKHLHAQGCGKAGTHIVPIKAVKAPANFKANGERTNRLTRQTTTLFASRRLISMAMGFPNKANTSISVTLVSALVSLHITAWRAGLVVIGVLDDWFSYHGFHS